MNRFLKFLTKNHLKILSQHSKNETKFFSTEIWVPEKQLLFVRFCGNFLMTKKSSFARRRTHIIKNTATRRTEKFFILICIGSMIWKIFI